MDLGSPGPKFRVFVNSYTQCLHPSTFSTNRGESSQTESKRMRKFDPWPVFFKREFNRNWPFLVGFAVTGAIITKFSLGLTGTYPFYFSHSSDQRPSNSYLLIVWIFFCCRGRQEKLRLCPKTQEVRHKTPNLTYFYSTFVTLDLMSLIIVCLFVFNVLLIQF